MDNSNEVAFDKEIRSLIDKYTSDCLLSAGEIVAVLEFVKHSVIVAALAAAEE